MQEGQTYGIKHQFTTPYTPQQNGISETINRSIFKAILAMLFDFKFKKRILGLKQPKLQIYYKL